MCWKRRLVDCRRCHRRRVETQEPEYVGGCGINGCNVWSPANNYASIEDMETHTVVRHGCPECAQPSFMDSSLTETGPQGSRDSSMVQGGGDRVPAQEQWYQSDRDTRPARQEEGALVRPQDLHYLLDSNGRPAPLMLPELRHVSLSPPRGTAAEGDVDDSGGGRRHSQRRQPKDEKCDVCRLERNICDVLQHHVQQLGCSYCARNSRVCMFQGQRLQRNQDVPGANPIWTGQRPETKCERCNTNQSRCDTDGTYACTSCMEKKYICRKGGVQLPRTDPQ